MKKIVFLYVSIFLTCAENLEKMFFCAKVLNIKTINQKYPHLKLHREPGEYKPTIMETVLSVINDKNQIKDNDTAYFYTSKAMLADLLSS